MRPVFKKGSQQGTGTTQPGHQPTASTAHPQSTPSPTSVKQAEAKALHTPANSQQPVLSSPAAPVNTSATNEQRRIKSVSIFSGETSSSNQPPVLSDLAKIPTGHSTSETSAERHIDQTELEVGWRKASNELATIDRAINMRMESITPTLKSQEEIELAVGNQNVESFFRTHKDVIISHLKKYIGEGPLTMSFRIVETGGPQKILSPHEQMIEMTKQNPSLGKLREALGLTVE